MTLIASSVDSGVCGQRPEPVVLSFPLPRTHTGVPLGNGAFGALVWGRNTLNITINRSDFWDHREGQELLGERMYEQVAACYDPNDSRACEAPFEALVEPWTGGDFRNTRLPMGRFELVPADELTLTDATLRVDRGELVVRLLGASAGEVRRVTIALHPQLPVLLLHDPMGAITDIRGQPAWQWVSAPMQSRGFVEPMILDRPGEVGWVQTCPQDDAMAALCRRAPGAIVIAMTPGPDAHAAQSSASGTIDQVLKAGPVRFLREVNDWWQRYADSLPQVRLPDPFFQQFLALTQFKFGAATSPNSETPCGLQGPWCEEYQMPPWSGGYYFDENVQQIYTLAFTLGKVDHLMPLFDMLDRCLPRFRRNARRMVGIDDGVVITLTTDDHGLACGGVGAAVIDQASTGWAARLYWLYYQFTGDVAFLRDRAWPMLEGAMRTYEAMIQWREGRPHLPVTISAEYGRPMPDGSRHRYGANASSQLACMHMLLNALLEACPALGRHPRESWLKLRDVLPHWTLTGATGQERIAIWNDVDLDVSHRHHSHLSCLYPFDTLAQRSPQQQAIIDRSLRRWLEIGMSDWSEWSLPWAAIIQAREGYRESPALLLRICRELYINEGLATVYIPRFPGFSVHGYRLLTGPLETCEVMQLDGAMGVATALYEMLVHQYRGVVRFFPAVPAAWKDVAFQGVHLPGPCRASGEMSGGEVTNITLQATAGGAFRVDVPGYRTLKFQTFQGERAVPLPADLVLDPGQTLTATPAR
jgi:hypothetical protein